jgi:RimJ/RimL family protein N-acetyltransferase
MSVVIPTLETERLILRAFRDADHAAVADFYGNDPASKYVGGPMDSPMSWRRIATFLGHWQLRGFGPFALERKDTGAWVGMCNLWCPPEFPEREIGWGLIASERGQGLAHEAALRVRRHALETLGWSTLVSYIVPENEPSRRVASRLGAVCERTIQVRDNTVEVWRHPRAGGDV